ncbi:toll/interleukin-1 receptor domain-containing protein [Frankia sp. AgB32]|uniref:toll/interleukin-1 receptor domain-containing protein n=1 Tax=Frankia sp. AgB32 TaxID=631119 RepID=UPI00200DD032|nr:toll/interleukin-1 receptor domain-containing protein [Frankia sp. AgB32]MCK9897838.1 toll/interleukin-1 receptor domain-containing protein [Frankia sp. AgB32]
MPDASAREPLVYLSCVAADQDVGDYLATQLRRQGIDARQNQQVPPGANWVLWIDDALSRFDCYALLWSAAAALDSGVARAEWTAALARELAERTLSLLVVRLDDSPPPPLLASYRSLDATHGRWDDVARELAAIGRGSWSPPAAAVPPPRRTDTAMTTGLGGMGAAGGTGLPTATRTIRVRNRALRFAIVLAVPPVLTVWQLVRCVRTELSLPDEQIGPDGHFGFRFHYRLSVDGKPLPDEPDTLAQLPDDALVDLEVVAEPFGPDGELKGTTTYRLESVTGQAREMPSALMRTLVRDAFRHVSPP